MTASMVTLQLHTMTSVIAASAVFAFPGPPAAVVTDQALSAEMRLLSGLSEVADMNGPGSFGLVMGGTGNPGPDPVYYGQMLGGYLDRMFPGMPSDSSINPVPGWHTFATPEQFCPIVCVAMPPGLPSSWNGLNFGDSVNVGAAGVTDSVNTNLDSLDDPNGIVLSGYSQSGTVVTVALNKLISEGNLSPEQLTNLHYMIIGDPNTPLGGMLDRFQFPDSLTGGMQHVPFLNIPMGIAPTPTDVGPSAIVTGEYDGWANEPQDPVTGLLALINALIGIETVHGFYPDYSAGQIASAVDVGTVGSTDMYFIPENLPILQFLYSTDTTAGQFFADGISPWLRLVIDWAYGNAGDPGTNLVGAMGENTAGGAGVDGMYLISPDQPTDAGSGAFIYGSPYQASVGVAGGPWSETPYGDLWQSTLTDNAGPLGLSPTIADSGIAGIFEKMDPLQLIAGVQNALIQSLIGPWADVFAGNSPTMDAGELAVVNGITGVLRTLTGYDLVNGLDQLLLGGVHDLGLQSAIDGLLDGPLIPGQPIIDAVGLGFDVFNVFGA